MKLLFRVVTRSMYGEPNGQVWASLTLKPLYPTDPADPNYQPWRGARPQGELLLSFLDPEYAEQFAPNTLVDVKISTRSATNEQSRDQERRNQPPGD